MQPELHVPLIHYNTFGIQAQAARLLRIKTKSQLHQWAGQPVSLILGGGSNILFTDDVDGLVLKNEIKGRRILTRHADQRSVIVCAGGGENWHQFVRWTLRHNLGGLENLSLIPGTVGAAPIQNIGAYGVELKDSFHKLRGIDLHTGEVREYHHSDCQFGYRDSIFKHAPLKGRFFITQVYFRLTTQQHLLHLSYGDIVSTLQQMQVAQPTIQHISEAVCAIRSAKLPDPAQLGNAGSFFKNPEIPAPQYEALKSFFPDMPAYALPDGNKKIPAAWLIERCGWKGKRIGNTGSHARQALVLVNYGNATGKEIWQLALDIRQSVHERFGILLSPEVNVVPLG